MYVCMLILLVCSYILSAVSQYAKPRPGAVSQENEDRGGNREIGEKVMRLFLLVCLFVCLFVLMVIQLKTSSPSDLDSCCLVVSYE